MADQWVSGLGVERSPEKYPGAPPCPSHCPYRATLPERTWLPLSLDPPTPYSKGRRVGTPKGAEPRKGAPARPLCPLLIDHGPGVVALWIPWRVSPGAGPSPAGPARTRAGSGTEPQGERRWVEAKVCKITGKSGPNHSPSRSKLGRRSCINLE